MADYAFLLRNIMDFLYKDNDVQYPGKGRVFYTRRVEEGFKQQEKDFLENLMVRDIMENEIPFALMNDPEKGKVNYLSLYQEKFLSIFDKKRNIKKAYGRLSITNLIFLGIHLGGWIPASRWFNGRIENHDRAIVSNLMKGDKKNGTEPRRNDFISDLSKWQFNPDNETNPISTLSENDRSSPAGYIPITEYIVTCNHELIKNCCPGSRKEHLKDIINDFTFTKIIGDTAKTFEKQPMDDQIIDDYLTGKNNDFEVEYEKRLPAIKKDALLDVNDICNELADNFQISLTIGGSINEAINEVFEGDPSPEEMLRRMKETKAGRKIDERLNYAFYKLEDSSDGSTKFYCAAGITGIDRFRIDGRSPKELWGDKYASIKDANDRDMLIKTELFKELLLGNSQIVAENYVITNDNKIIKQGAYKLTYTPKEIESYRSFIAEVDALHENFEKVQKLFEKYQKDPEANFGGEKKEGSKLYRDMIKALKKCLDTTAGSSDATKEDIFKAIQEYQKTAETYYKERKGVVTGPVTSKGIVRLGLAEDAMNNLMERYDRLHILSEGLDLDVGKYDRAGRKAIRNIRYHIIRAEENRGRKLEHKDFKMEVVKKQPFYSENKKAKKKAAERNKNYTENPVYQQVKAAYPKTYMKNWCKALDGAEKIQMERSSNRSADEAHLPRNSKHSIVRSSNCSESPTKKSTFSRT